MSRTSIILYLFIVPFLLQAQGEANNWYFGNQAGITFNNGGPEALTDGALDTFEGCATISDASGNLLFYSDGISIWNRNHQVMPNGANLLGNPSSTQSGLIVPHPGDPNLFYVFSLEGFGDPNGLRYSVVDMSLDGDLGDVTDDKNVLLYTPSTEKITAVTHANGNDIWVITHNLNSNEFICYLVTDSGLNTTPVVTAVGHTALDGIVDGVGYMKVSPDGTKLAVAYFLADLVELLEFDTETGIMSNPIQITDSFSNINYGVEFSPNGEILYITSGDGGINQFDISTLDATLITDSKLLIGTGGSSGSGESRRALQLGPDGKIYVSNFDYGYLSVINNPNVLGSGCNYVIDGVFLGGKLSRIGLPPFIQSYFQIDFEVVPICEGRATQFAASISQAYDSLIWDFGDGNTSTEENPSHTYTLAGDYEVSLSVTSGSESSVDTNTITVYETPTVTPIVELRQCDDDLDGVSSFNLVEVNAEISVNHLDETITYYETELDAENAENPITDINNYSNEITSSDMLWARVENSFGCYAISQVDLVVSTTQIPDTFIRDFYQCDDGVNTTDGIATFNFSLVDAEIEALFPVGQQLDINYYENEADALAESNAISDITNYQNTDYPNSQEIYVRVDDAANNDCLGLGHHITLYVEPLPLITGPVMIEQCDEGNDGVEFFDTSGIESELSMGQTQAIVFTYEDEFGNPLPSPLPDPFEVSVPIFNIFATMTATDSNNDCSVRTSIALSINSSVSVNPVDTFIACDADLDGQYTFDTSALEFDLFGAPPPDTQISYTDGGGNTISSPFPNSFTTGNQTVTATITNTLNADCFASYEVEFIVYPQPNANAIEDDFVCDDLANDGEHVFTLSDYDPQILNGQPSSTFEVYYFENEADAQSSAAVPLPDAYLVSSTAKAIYARIQNKDYPDCFDVTSFELGVNYLPVAYQPSDIELCDMDNDGSEIIDLTLQDDAILNGQTISDVTITYHLNSDDAQDGINALPTSYPTTTNPQTLFARLENTDAPYCYAITSFEIRLYDQPELLMKDLWPICEGNTVEILADEGYDSYSWSSGQMTRVITVDEPGWYTVTASNTYGDLICSTEKTVSVSLSNIAIITDIETVDWSQDNNRVTVFVEGDGDYEYSVDGITYQDSNQFSGLLAEEYEVYVRDKNGCGIASETIYLLNYPRYFTPNGDGIHDYWQIKNGVKEPLNKLYIYDRYGKLLKQVGPTGYGWDGTFNGKQLPSSDYWFVLERQNGNTYTGHFSLKR